MNTGPSRVMPSSRATLPWVHRRANGCGLLLSQRARLSFYTGLLALAVAFAVVGAPQPSNAPGGPLLRTQATSVLDLSQFTTTGNLSTQLQPDGASGVAMVQPLQLFKNAGFLGCEGQITGGLFTPGGVVGGKKAMTTVQQVGSGGFAGYSNGCGRGYNQSASVMVQASFYIFVGNGGGVTGSIQIGMGNAAAPSTNTGECGPFVNIRPISTGQISTIQLGVSFGYTNAQTMAPWTVFPTGSRPANQTWYTVYVYSNGTSQRAVLQQVGGPVLWVGTSAISWSSGSCQSGNDVQSMRGTAIFLNQTCTLGCSWKVGFNNVSMGASTVYGSTPFGRTGVATTGATSVRGKLSSFALTYLTQLNAWKPLTTWSSTDSGTICPCWVNASGVTLWTQATPVTLPSGYVPQVYSLDVSSGNVPVGTAFTLAFIFTSTDAIAVAYVSEVDAVWTPVSPGGGPPPPPPLTYCQAHPLALECVQNVTVVRTVVTYVCNLWALIVIALLVMATAVARRAARRNPGPQEGRR